MLHDLFVWLLATFVVAPVHADLQARLAGMNAPPAMVRQLGDCAVTAGPALAARATEDPWWGLRITAGAALGFVEPRSVLAEAAPSCAAALAAAQPLLNGREAGPRG